MNVSGLFCVLRDDPVYVFSITSRDNFPLEFDELIVRLQLLQEVFPNIVLFSIVSRII